MIEDGPNLCSFGYLNVYPLMDSRLKIFLSNCYSKMKTITIDNNFYMFVCFFKKIKKMNIHIHANKTDEKEIDYRVTKDLSKSVEKQQPKYRNRVKYTKFNMTNHTCLPKIQNIVFLVY